MGAAGRSGRVPSARKKLARSRTGSGRGPPGCSQTCRRAAFTRVIWLSHPTSYRRRNLRASGVSSLAGPRSSAMAPQYRWNKHNVSTRLEDASYTS